MKSGSFGIHQTPLNFSFLLKNINEHLMMNFLSNFWAFWLSLTLIGCAPVSSELWIHSDGSGKLEATFDLKEMIEMMGPMLSSLDSSDGSMEFDLFDGEESIDSMSSFYAITPDSSRERVANPDLLKKVFISLKVDSAAQIAEMKMITTFKDRQELEKIIEAMEQVRPDSSNAEASTLPMEIGTDFDKYFLAYELDMQKGVLRLPQADMKEEIGDDALMSDLLPMLDSLQHYSPDSQEFQFLEMFFGGEMTTVVHLPGKVKKVSRPAVIEGNTVTIRTSVLEELKRQTGPEDIVIKFKKPK